MRKKDRNENETTKKTTDFRKKKRKESRLC